MKRVYCFAVFILFLCLPFLISAQLPGTVNVEVGDGQNGDPSSFVTIDGCDLTYRFTTYVFNLDYLNGVDLGNLKGAPIGYFYLPPEYETMYLRCEIYGVVDTVEVDSFQYYPDSEVGGYAFRFDHYITVDISDICQDKIHTFEGSIDVAISMLTSDGSFYPVCDHMGTNDIFECNYMSDDCPLPVCFNKPWAHWEGPVSFECGLGCGLADPRGLSEEAALAVYPNPFHREINIEWDNPSEESMIQLYTINGELMKSWTISNHLVGEVTKISTHDLPEGVYYLMVRNEGKFSYHKLIKG